MTQPLPEIVVMEGAEYVFYLGEHDSGTASGYAVDSATSAIVATAVSVSLSNVRSMLRRKIRTKVGRC